MIFASFALAKDMFITTNVSLCCGKPRTLRRGNQPVIAQQLPLNLVSPSFLLDFPSNHAKHKKIGD